VETSTLVILSGLRVRAPARSSISELESWSVSLGRLPGKRFPPFGSFHSWPTKELRRVQTGGGGRGCHENPQGIDGRAWGGGASTGSAEG
jgi:hypothetical protein